MEPEDRLNRIEDKLDRITEILATQKEHDQRLIHQADRLKRCEEKLETVGPTIQQNRLIAAAAQWLAAALIGGLLVWIFKQF